MDTTKLIAIMLKVIVLTSGLIGASGQLRMTPENTAGVVGTSVVLQCQGSLDAPAPEILWNEYILTTTATPIAYNGDVYPNAPNSQLYSITGDSSMAQFHLNIELAFLSGGRYGCNQPYYSLFGFSHVTVLQSAPACSDTIQADGIVEEGETITYTCQIAYNSTSIDWPPVMTWTGPEGTITDVNKLSTSGGKMISYVNVTGAPGLNGAVYSVRTHFEAYGGSLPADHATNIPTYSHTHKFNILQVQYKPVNIVISSEQDCYTPGNSLTCSADGNPDPLYQWQNLQDNISKDGSVLTINVDMKEEINEFRCEAYNTIKGTNRSTWKNITFTVTDACADDVRLLTKGEIAGICVGVIAGFGIIVAVIIVIKKKKKTSIIN